MKMMNAIPNGQIVAKYKKSYFTWTCRICDDFYCATISFRRTVRTYYSKDKNEINELIKKEIADGFKRV